MAMTSDPSRTVPDDWWSALRERVERDRVELIAQLDTTLDDRPEPTATTGQGETEHVASEVEQRVQAVLDEGGTARLVELDDALRRFDDGTYGRCERCGSPISTSRLEALPHARFCMRCQREEDAQLRRRVPR
jgi:RNA polymerase-binding transcription factor DksA